MLLILSGMMVGCPINSFARINFSMAFYCSIAMQKVKWMTENVVALQPIMQRP
jgi:hypothetical protein